MRQIDNMHDLYIEMLQDLYNAEVLLVSELLLFHKMADDVYLAEGLKAYLNDCRAHIQRLEDLLEELDQSLFEDHCRSMKSMIFEGKKVAQKCARGRVKDFAIAASLQRINGCKTTVYRTLISLNRHLAYPNHQEILEKSLKEEEKVGQLLKERIEYLQNVKQPEI